MKENHIVYCIDFDKNNNIYAGLNNDKIYIWNIISKECIRILIGHSGSVYCLVVSGDILLSGSKDKTIKIWNINTGDCLKTIQSHYNSVQSLSLYRNQLVSCSTSNYNSSPKRQAQILLWTNFADIRSYHNRPECDLVSLTFDKQLLSNRLWLFNCFKVDINEKFIVSILNHNIIVYEKQTKNLNLIECTEIDSLNNQAADVTYLKLSSEFDFIIGGFKNGAIGIWNLESLDLIKKILEHSKQIICIRCDDYYLLTGSYK